ncbi:MAG: Spy/CpxP family protein refolding chaperone [bacterium]
MKKHYISTTLIALSLFAFSSGAFAQNVDKLLISDNTQAQSTFNKECQRPKIKDYLNLTPDQAQKAKAMREASKGKIKPLIDNLKAEYQKLKQMREQKAPSQDIAQQQEKVRAMRKQVQQVREENMKQFEAILTPDQKVQFAKFREERKAEMKKYHDEKGEHHNFNKD